MKATHPATSCIALTASIFLMSTLSILAQGPLAPTGAPGPTMKSLDQIEARTPIASAPFTITTSGSYYLTKSVSVASGDAITINANDVTLDLNGFTISSTNPNPVTGTGILIGSSLHNITISNGHISGAIVFSAGSYGGSGFYNGIYFSGGPPLATRVVGVTISGCKSMGIDLSSVSSTVVESCAVNTVGGYGVAAATVNNCTALQCGLAGIAATNANNCFGATTGSDDGIVVLNNAMNCNGTSVTGNGINAATATSCTGTVSGGAKAGILAKVAFACFGTSNGTGKGLDATNAIACSGTATSGAGLNAVTTVGCSGTATGGIGLNATNAAASNGSSTSNDGLKADTAMSCSGTSTSDNGLSTQAASTCYGKTTSGDNGLLTFAGSACFGNNANGLYGMNGFVTVGSFGQLTGSSPNGYGLISNLADSSFGTSTFVAYRYDMPATP